MKSVYFTSKLLDAQARKLLEESGPRRKPPGEWGRLALLVLDMQDYFLDPVSHAYLPSADAILPGIAQLIDRFRRRGLPVIFTRHINTPADAGMMTRWWREIILADNPLSRLSARLDVDDSPVIEKTQYDAFYSTPLESLLRREAVCDVLITGVMTHLCCETTARSAFVRGFQVWFSVDGTATKNREFHLSTLRALSHGFAAPLLVSEALALL